MKPETRWHKAICEKCGKKFECRKFNCKVEPNEEIKSCYCKDCTEKFSNVKCEYRSFKERVNFT